MLVKAAHGRNDPGIAGSLQTVLIFFRRFAAHAIQVLGPSFVMSIAFGAVFSERRSKLGGQRAAALGHAGIAL